MNLLNILSKYNLRNSYPVGRHRDHGNLVFCLVLYGITFYTWLNLDPLSGSLGRVVFAGMVMFAGWHLAQWAIARRRYGAYLEYLQTNGFDRNVMDYDDAAVHSGTIAINEYYRRRNAGELPE